MHGLRPVPTEACSAPAPALRRRVRVPVDMPTPVALRGRAARDRCPPGGGTRRSHGETGLRLLALQSLSRRDGRLAQAYASRTPGPRCCVTCFGDFGDFGDFLGARFYTRLYAREGWGVPMW